MDTVAMPLPMTLRLTGVSFGECQNTIRSLKAGERVDVLPRFENAYDANAIEVRTKDGRSVGWIPKMENHILADYIRSGRTILGEVSSVDGGYSPGVHMGITVRLFAEPTAGTTDDRVNIVIGQRLRHLVFGDGVIVALDPGDTHFYVTVQFADPIGKKRLLGNHPSIQECPAIVKSLVPTSLKPKPVPERVATPRTYTPSQTAYRPRQSNRSRDYDYEYEDHDNFKSNIVYHDEAPLSELLGDL